MSWWWPFKKSVNPASKWTPEQQAWLDEFRKPTPANPTSDFIPSRTMVPYGQDVMEHWKGKLTGVKLFKFGGRQDKDSHYYSPRTTEESVSGSIYFIVESENSCSPRFMVVGPTETVLETNDRDWAELMKERFNSAFDLGVIKGGWKE